MPIPRVKEILSKPAREFAGDILLILKVNNHEVLHDEKNPTQAITSPGALVLRTRPRCIAADFVELIPAGKGNASGLGPRE